MPPSMLGIGNGIHHVLTAVKLLMILMSFHAVDPEVIRFGAWL